jgi:RNA polymerase sigma-70 factor (ECF subfamily)
VVPEIPALRRRARGLTGASCDADDLVQETLVRAYRAIDRFDGRYPRAWLHTIVRNARLNQFRRTRPGLLDDPNATLAEIADPSPLADVEASVVDRTMAEAVGIALKELPLGMRRALQLVDQGFRYQEAADILGIPVGTVMSRLHRARRRLRHRLEEEGMTPTTTR